MNKAKHERAMAYFYVDEKSNPQMCQYMKGTLLAIRLCEYGFYDFGFGCDIICQFVVNVHADLFNCWPRRLSPFCFPNRIFDSKNKTLKNACFGLATINEKNQAFFVF